MSYSFSILVLWRLSSKMNDTSTRSLLSLGQNNDGTRGAGNALFVLSESTGNKNDFLHFAQQTVIDAERSDDDFSAVVSPNRVFRAKRHKVCGCSIDKIEVASLRSLVLRHQVVTRRSFVGVDDPVKLKCFSKVALPISRVKVFKMRDRKKDYIDDLFIKVSRKSTFLTKHQTLSCTILGVDSDGNGIHIFCFDETNVKLCDDIQVGQVIHIGYALVVENIWTSASAPFALRIYPSVGNSITMETKVAANSFADFALNISAFEDFIRDTKDSKANGGTKIDIIAKILRLEYCDGDIEDVFVELELFDGSCCASLCVDNGYAPDLLRIINEGSKMQVGDIIGVRNISGCVGGGSRFDVPVTFHYNPLQCDIYSQEDVMLYYSRKVELLKKKLVNESHN